MRQRTDVIFVYDGSFDGFLCCVYEYYYSQFNPVDVVCEEEFYPSFYPVVTVETDIIKADKVRNAVCEKISGRTLRFMQECHLCYGKEKEYHMLRYLVKAFKKGRDIYAVADDDDVDYLRKAQRHLQREKHLYLGLVRFYKAEDVYISVINPKNKILPLIAHHFTQRFYNQNFMIYDKNNKQALIHSKKETDIVQALDVQLPQMSEDEKSMQKLWKLFYDTIAIKERYNPRCRMNFMPKRTWDLLPEMQDL